jgi:hypothetical protein
MYEDSVQLHAIYKFRKEKQDIIIILTHFN